MSTATLSKPRAPRSALKLQASRPAPALAVAAAKGCELPPPSTHASLTTTLLNHSQQGIMGLDTALRITFANKALIAMFPGKPIVMGRAIAAALPMGELPTLAQQCLSRGEPLSTRFTCLATVSLNHNERHFFAQCTPLPLNVGGGVSLLIHDITDELMTERIRSDFVTNASHELRTPLTLINGYIETLKSGLVKNIPAMQRCLEVMDKHSRRMLRLIEDMLTISRFEGIGGQLKRESFHVRHCVEDALEHLTPIIALRQPTIILDFPAADGVLHGDRFYWDQIFTNLIENAIKENPQQGLIVTISGEWHEQGCVLKVSDNGVGIPAEDLPFVFKRFFRCAKHHSSAVQGTGLGLSIVRRAVEAHGGTIDVQSVAWQQTSFVMRVPRLGATQP